MSDENLSAVPEVQEAPAPSAPAPAPAEPRQTQFNSVQDAVAELERRESARRAEAQAAKAAKAQQASQAPQEPEAADDEPPSPEPLESREDFNDSDEVATDEPQDEPAEPEDAADLEEIEINGKTFKVPKEAALRQADYTRKTQELAQERQQVQAAYQQTAQTAQQLQQAQAVLAQFYQAAIGQPPGLELAQSDPQAYLVQREMHQQRLNAFQQLMAQGQQLAQHQGALSEQQRQEMEARETAAMLKHLPELKSPQKRAEFAQKAVKVGERYGYTPQEIQGVMDHRAIRMLSDLIALQARNDAAGSVKQKLSNVPPRVAKPGTQTQDAGKGARTQDAKRQFMKSGRSMRDVARYLNSIEE